MINWKDNLMENIYRINQSQRFYGIIASTLVIAALYYEHIPFLSELDFLGKLSLAVIIILIFIAMGYVYDKKLKLWEHDHVVIRKRNPYTYDLLTDKEKLIFHNRFIQMKSLKKINDKLDIKNTDLDLEIKKLENWIKDGRINKKENGRNNSRNIKKPKR